MSRGASGSAFSTVIDLFVLLKVFRASSESILENLEGSTPLPFAMPCRPDFHSNKPGWIFSLTATGGHSTCTNKIKYTSITARSFFAPLPGSHSQLASTTTAKRERMPTAHLANVRPRIRKPHNAYDGNQVHTRARQREHHTEEIRRSTDSDMQFSAGTSQIFMKTPGSSTLLWESRGLGT